MIMPWALGVAVSLGILGDDEAAAVEDADEVASAHDDCNEELRRLQRLPGGYFIDASAGSAAGSRVLPKEEGGCLILT